MEQKLKARREQFETLEFKSSCYHQNEYSEYYGMDNSCQGCRRLKCFQDSKTVWEANEDLIKKIYQDKPELDSDWLLAFNPLPSI